MFVDIKLRFEGIEKHIPELKNKSSKLDELDNLVSIYQKSLSFQAHKLTDLQDRSRRSNVVVFGISESPKETEAELKPIIIDATFKDKLGVTCKFVGRIHKIGKPGTKRPAILFFQDFNKTSAVLNNPKKLKGTKIFLQNDYSKQTLKKRKLLFDSAIDEKPEGKNVYLVHYKLYVDKKFLFGPKQRTNAEKSLERNSMRMQ